MNKSKDGYKLFYYLIISSFIILLISMIYSNINIFKIIFNFNKKVKSNNNQYYFILVLDIEIGISIINIMQTLIFGIYGFFKMKRCFLLVYLFFTIFVFISNILIFNIVLFYYPNQVNLSFYIVSALKEIIHLINIIFIIIVQKYFKNDEKYEKITLKTDNLSEKIFKALAEQQQNILSQNLEKYVDFSQLNIYSEDLNSSDKVSF